MRIVLCGVRGSTPAPGAAFARHGGHTSCVAVAADGEPPSLVLDAGTGISRVDALLGGRPFRGDVLLSHLHWDHVTGLPFFAAADRPDAVTTVHVPAADDAEAAALIDRLLSPPLFPIDLAALAGRWTVRAVEPGTFERGPWRVVARTLPHGRGTSLGYRISDGRSTIAYVTDHGPASTDDHHEAVRALAERADVLIHDAQHLAHEWDDVRHLGHASVDYAIGLARACGVGRLVLSHHAPTRTDVALDMVAASLPTGVTVAREGDVIDLP